MDPLHKIQHDMLLLKESWEVLHDVALDQQPMLDSIEDEISRSKEEVREGERQIVAAVEQSNSYRIYYLIAGAVTSIGTTVALLLLL